MASKETKENDADKEDRTRTRDKTSKNRPPSPGKETVVVIPGNPKGLTPPPDRYSPGTVVVTPELPPPEPMFPPEATPKNVKHYGAPPTPSRHRRRRVEPRSPRQSVKNVRDFVDDPPITPWSQRPDNGSMASFPRGAPSVMSPRSLDPLHGSVVSRFTKTLVNDNDSGLTPISSRWTFPRYNVRPPSNQTFRTFPVERPRRGDATPKPPRTSWSRVPRRGSLIAPPWSEKRLVADPNMSETAKWVGRHGAYAAEYSSRPMWLGYDVETDSDILQTPQGPRRFIGQEPEATDTSRWVERNFGDSRDWLDTPYYDGRYYQYDRRYMDVDQFSDYWPQRDYQPTNPILYSEKAVSTSKWINQNFHSKPIMLQRERRRHYNYEPGVNHPRKLLPVYRGQAESDTDSRHQRYRDHREALREKDVYRNLAPPRRLGYPESVRPWYGSDRRPVDSPEIPPDRYDRHDDESRFSRNSVKSHSHYRPRPQQRSDPGWNRYRDYGKDLENMGPPALPGRENVHRWLSQR